jgi:hypothetical protein
MADILRHQSAEPISSPTQRRSLWALRLCNTWLLAAQTMLNAVSSPSSRSH